jgi:Transposase, Mutator family
MALGRSALLELTEALSSADDGQLMRTLLHTILQALIDAEAAQHIGVDPHERTDARTTHRNGTRNKTVSTTAGDLTVKIAASYSSKSDDAPVPVTGPTRPKRLKASTTSKRSSLLSCPGGHLLACQDPHRPRRCPGSPTMDWRMAR